MSITITCDGCGIPAEVSGQTTKLRPRHWVQINISYDDPVILDADAPGTKSRFKRRTEWLNYCPLCGKRMQRTLASGQAALEAQQAVKQDEV